MDKDKYDVIVIGAGPAGSAAAKVVAERGLKAVLLEEHTLVGVPEHCWGLLHRTTRPELYEEILKTMHKSVVLTEYRLERVFAPSGKVVQEIPTAGMSDYLVRRDEFDRELARQAVNAGADLRVNTRVTGLLKQDGKVIGVSTNSNTAPTLYGKVVIGADGIHAAQRGTPKWEGLTRANITFTGGVTLELARVRDIEPDVLEWHTGAFIKRGWTGICPRDDVSCTIDFMSMAEFEQVKSGNYAISKKLRDAVPVRMTGWSHPSDLGVGLPKVVEDGLILAGSAAHLIGILPAIVSGRYAAEVAVEAIQEGDVTAKKLSKYEDQYEILKGPSGFLDSPPFYKCSSDEAIETLLLELIEKGELSFINPVPV
jgi:digeranylgeranylglycerophospholipid reductase